MRHQCMIQWCSGPSESTEGHCDIGCGNRFVLVAGEGELDHIMKETIVVTVIHGVPMENVLGAQTDHVMIGL
jgi:hypothetical protein